MQFDDCLMQKKGENYSVSEKMTLDKRKKLRLKSNPGLALIGI